MLSGGCAVGRVSIFGCVVLLGVVLLGVVLLGARLCEMCLDCVRCVSENVCDSLTMLLLQLVVFHGS